MLTIAIPTYNRAKYLNLCLVRISEEIDSLSKAECSLIQVCVVDNASTDDTPIVVSHHQEKFGNKLDVIRNDCNMGMDFNFTRCYEQAKTPYVWLLGDDDIITPGGLKKVLEVLVGSEIDILYVNNYWFQDSYKDKPKKNERHGTLKFRSSLDFARYTNVMLTFLSGLIVRSGVGMGHRSGFSNSNLVQLSWVLPLLSDGSNFMAIKDWVIAAKGSNSSGYGLVQVFGFNLVKITNDILSTEPVIARAIQNGAIVNFFSGFIMEFRNGMSLFSDRDMAIGLKLAFGNNWRYYVFLAPLIKLPLFVANYYLIFLKVIRRLFLSVLL